MPRLVAIISLNEYMNPQHYLTSTCKSNTTRCNCFGRMYSPTSCFFPIQTTPVKAHHSYVLLRKVVPAALGIARADLKPEFPLQAWNLLSALNRALRLEMLDAYRQHHNAFKLLLSLRASSALALEKFIACLGLCGQS